jgi:hypothetical protein
MCEPLLELVSPCKVVVSRKADGVGVLFGIRLE